MQTRCAAAVAGVLALFACTSGNGSGEAPPATSSTSVAAPSTTAPVGAGDSNGASPPPGHVALSALGVPLSGPGLRVLVGVVDRAMEVVVEGAPTGSAAVEACPVGGAEDVPDDRRCVAMEEGRAVEMSVPGGSAGGSTPGPSGVLLRPLGGTNAATVHLTRATFTYRPAGDSIVVVTPPVPPPGGTGRCAGGPCEMTLELVPTGSGTFSLDAYGRGAQPELTLRASPAGTSGEGASRVVSIVEGGGQLTIRSTVGGPTGVTLTLRNQGTTTLVPLELALRWPVGF